MCTSMGLENLVPIVYPLLPPTIVEDTWASYRNADDDDEDDEEADDEIQEESK
jgi:hypothetical protein